jgi:hypothetical protein
MCGIDITSEFKQVSGAREGRQFSVISRSNIGNSREVRMRGRVPVENTPVDCLAKIEGKSLKTLIMNASGCLVELGKGSNSVADVGADNDIGVHNFANEGAIGISHGSFEQAVFLGVFKVTGRSIEFLNNGGRQGFNRTGTWFGFILRWGIPIL